MTVMGSLRWRFDALVVLGEDVEVVLVVLLVRLERVGEDEAGERLVGRLLVERAADEVLVGRLDVDGGDVVGEQQDLVGVQLVRRTCGRGRAA